MIRKLDSSIWTYYLICKNIFVIILNNFCRCSSSRNCQSSNTPKYFEFLRNGQSCPSLSSDDPLILTVSVSEKMVSDTVIFKIRKLKKMITKSERRLKLLCSTVVPWTAYDSWINVKYVNNGFRLRYCVPRRYKFFFHGANAFFA